MLIFRRKVQERKMKDQIKKNKDMKKDEEKLKGQEVKEFFFLIGIHSMQG